jgi:hypothetical protein
LGCMSDIRYKLPIFLFLILPLIWPEAASPWSAPCHTFISQKAGIGNPENSNYPDLFKKENVALLGPYHYHNPFPRAVITPDYIDKYKIVEQSCSRWDNAAKQVTIRMPDAAGVLYWKILEIYREMKGKAGWEYEYYLINIAHYVGDLSNPLHNFPSGSEPASDGKVYYEIGSWAKDNHETFDTILDSALPLDRETEKIFDAWITSTSITSEDSLKREIAKIANDSLSLANRCYADKRVMTLKEALMQTAKSVSLLRAIIADTRSRSSPPE